MGIGRWWATTLWHRDTRWGDGIDVLSLLTTGSRPIVRVRYRSSFFILRAGCIVVSVRPVDFIGRDGGTLNVFCFINTTGGFGIVSRLWLLLLLVDIAPSVFLHDTVGRTGY